MPRETEMHPKGVFFDSWKFFYNQMQAAFKTKEEGDPRPEREGGRKEGTYGTIELIVLASKC